MLLLLLLLLRIFLLILFPAARVLPRTNPHRHCHQRRYYEANIAGAAYYRHGAVKAMVASFQLLYGTPAGKSLRAWCKSHGIVLMWARNTLFARGEQPSYPANRRLVDPQVVVETTANASAAITSNATAAVFRAVWTKAAARLPAPNATVPSPSLPNAAASALWGELWKRAPDEARSEPPRARSCAAPIDHCVGVSPSGVCLCYSHAHLADPS